MSHVTHPMARRARSSRRQRGLAALIVVMVLFFVVSLAAAYANRNLVFEQRTSANQYRATQSLEAAQAGIEWAVAMLNQGRINDNCAAVADGVSPSFRERYLTTDPVTGLVTPRLRPDNTARSAACVFNGANWACSCPQDGAVALAAPAGTEVRPAYQVRFVEPQGTPTPGTVRIESVACPRFDAGCLAFDNNDGAEGRASVSVLVALHSSIKTIPAAPLTARRDVTPDPGATMRAFNQDPASGGLAIHRGGTLSGGILTTGTAGSPGVFALLGDGTLAALQAAPPLLPTVSDRMFANVFGLAPEVYRRQPATVELGNCPCTAAMVRAAIANNPLRPIWVAGDLALDTSGNIGSVSEPVTLVVTGSVTASAAVQVPGVVYSRAATWTTSGNATYLGAAVAENDFTGTGSSTFVYDPSLLNRLRVTSGSFVVVPGSWKDFPSV